MTRKEYDLSMLFIMIFIAAVIITTLITNEILIAAGAVLLSVIIALGIRRKFHSDLTEDERDRRLRCESSRAALIFYVMAAALPAFILVVLGKNGNPVLSAVGYTLQASILLILFVDIAAYYIMNRKHME